MPRDGSGVYTLPYPDVVTNTTIASTVFNGFEHDIATDLNAPRPIVAGGTGASSAASALANLKGETSGQVVTNYDSHVFLPGSFYSDSSATAEPVDGHAFVGLCAWVDANNMYLEAFDRDDASQPGALWFRQKKAGVWSAWAKAQALNIVGTPVANQFTTWQSSTALQGVALTGLVKGNGASAPTAAVAGTDYSTVAVANIGAQKITLSGANGSAPTAMRSDAAPPLDISIAPTWTGVHTFNNNVALTGSSNTAPTQAAGNNTTQIATTAFVASEAVRYDASQSLTAGQQNQAQKNLGLAGLMRSYLSGLTLSTAGSSAIFGISAGIAADSTNADLMALTSAYTKTTAAWGVGTGVGALDTGTINASAWYYVFLIKRVDTGVVDVLISLSAIAPTLPASYTLFRRIGAMKTTSSVWVKFRQINDEFLWDTPILDANNVNPGTAGATYSLSIPSGITVRCDTQFTFICSAGANFVCYIESLLTAVAAIGIAGAYQLANATTSVAASARLGLWSSNSSINAKCSGASGNQFYAVTFGWTDFRGKDA